MLLCFLPLLASAQREKASLIGVGYTSILDTYLSQETAKGTEVRYAWEKANRKLSKADSTALRHWSTYVSQDVFASFAGTRGNDNSFLGAMYNLRFGWHYNFDLPSDINVRVGGLADVALGGLYNTRNSNNPAQARAALSIDPSLMATWHFRIKNRPFALRYEAAMPLIGIAFSPNYGQSYYEIFTRGNYDHNVVLSHPFNTPSMRHALTLQLHLKKVSLRLGYLGDYQQADVNNLKYHNYSHLVVFGITRRFHIVNH